MISSKDFYADQLRSRLNLVRDAILYECEDTLFEQQAKITFSRLLMNEIVERGCDTEGKLTEMVKEKYPNINFELFAIFSSFFLAEIEHHIDFVKRLN